MRLIKIAATNRLGIWFIASTELQVQLSLAWQILEIIPEYGLDVSMSSFEWHFPRSFTFKPKLSRYDWLAIGLLLLYVIIFSTLNIRQQNSFNTNALDLAKFDQSIWNTSRGRPYQITIGEDLVIESHFSPALALFAPLYWLWPDIRILFLAKNLLLGGAGFLIYWHFRRQAPLLGLIVFAAYLMHPNLHKVSIVEFRRLTLAAFATSFAIYHLLRRQYGWMALGLALVLLSKEDLSLLVAAFGLYILLFQRNLKVGFLTLVTGLAWFILVPFALLPRLMSHDQVAGYQHAASSYGYLGGTLPEILNTLRTRPLVLWDYIGDPWRLTAVFNFFWPTVFFFLLAPEIAFFMLPNLGLLLASEVPRMGRLGGWYPTVLLVILYWAVGLGLSRLPSKWRQPSLALLLIFGFAAWLSRSEMWPGRLFDKSFYQVSEHDRQVVEALREIPAEAIVMAQDPMVPHLSHREEIYLLPWVRGGNQPDYVLMDSEMRTYPVGPDEYRTLFNDYLASTEYEIAQQIDSYYAFQYVGDVAPGQETAAVWPDTMQLQGITVAAAPPGEAFTTVETLHDSSLPAGSMLRVALLWEVLGEMEQNYTVFVHALDANDMLLGQHDGWPADAHRPTAVLPVGEVFRDVHYLLLKEPAALSDIKLRIGLYDSISGEILQSSEPADYVELPAKSE